jgi:D-alanine-D-alanine ligase-like ATP-grasp enzyme
MSENLLIRYDEVYLETEPIAVIKLLPRELEQKHRELKFQKSYDDLDYLEYVRLDVMQDRTVALISHENTPMPGTDICVAPGQLDRVSILINTIERLELSDRDLSWIHPDYKQEFQRSLRSQQNLVT